MLVSEAKEQGLIVPECAPYIHDNCEVCGAPIGVLYNEITNNLSTLYCTNDNCFSKIARRMELMLKDLDIPDFGPSTCETFIEMCGLERPFEIFYLDTNQFPDVLSMDRAEKLYINLHKTKTYTLAKLVKSLHLNGIAESADKLFANYSDIEEFYDDLEQGQEHFIAGLLDIGTTEGRAYNYYVELINNKDDVIEFCQMFDIESTDEVAFQIAITGGVSGYPNKDNYVAYLSSLGKGRITRSDTLTKTCKYLVADNQASGTSKLDKAKRMGVQVVSSQELIDIMRNT